MLQRPSENRKRYDAFCDDYAIAWHASEKPRRTDVEELFVGALDGTPPPCAQVHALWIFFRSELQKNAPLNWFCGEQLDALLMDDTRIGDALRMPR